ncbi:MAG: 23S rRNA (pseudouridine(1915)-N(3))-methyltransferase RlmH [Alphaproteobacteria bacterium]
MPEADIVARYCARLSKTMPAWKIECREITHHEGKLASEKEAEQLLQLIPAGFVTIALDGAGKTFNSGEFAQLLQRFQDEATGLCFLIGGSDGHGRKLIASVQHLLSLGAMTWPHLLARAMLLEQIYRSKMILQGHPYHK